MSKLTVTVSCPIDTYSGYGARSRDFLKALQEIGEYDIKVISQRWGNTRFGYLKDHNETSLQSLIVPKIDAQPDIWIQCTVPNEFQKVGKFNIGLTAGIETTVCAPSWVEGCNRMDLILVSSEHSKKVFLDTAFDQKDKRTNQVVKQLKIEKPIEVLLEGADLDKYKPIKSTFDLSMVKENFCLLFVGHWLQGKLGEDRKNVGFMIKSFLETYKNKPNAPALILKTSSGTTSLLDQTKVLKKIDNIRKTVKGKLPSIYLIHGDLPDSEINNLYNHPKVKAMISLTKGEGFGRPLLEFSLTKKPIIASAWSGQVDFLDPQLALLVGGELKQIDPSAVVKDVLIPESGWFQADPGKVAKAYKDIVKNYKKHEVNAKRLAYKNKTNFSFEAMVAKVKEYMTNYMPEMPKQVELSLPKLDLPKLKKV
jgi:glycosyltransferase involved in cell wall biosynthesis|tara:strand:+ start:1494 stop:2762 length:1269 start_codon:yes stop_codon:yes gene_type:complete